jgi:brefeldin A-inhibited guanine nucleotide-exchange protein 3
LFGALRVVRTESFVNRSGEDSETSQINILLDVFEVFVNTDNPLVFSNAAIDCILCLLKYVRGPCKLQKQKIQTFSSHLYILLLVTSTEDSMSSSGENFEIETPSVELCITALKYLQRCFEILTSMHRMPACPIFHAAHR